MPVARYFNKLSAYAGDSTFPLNVRLYYERRDPYAVRMDITSEHGQDPVVWVVSREFFDRALTGSVREAGADISADLSPGGDVTRICLHPPNADAVTFCMPLNELADFLGATYFEVPCGKEPEYCALVSDLEKYLKYYGIG